MLYLLFFRILGTHDSGTHSDDVPQAGPVVGIPLLCLRLPLHKSNTSMQHTAVQSQQDVTAYLKSNWYCLSTFHGSIARSIFSFIQISTNLWSRISNNNKIN